VAAQYFRLTFSTATAPVGCGVPACLKGPAVADETPASDAAEAPPEPDPVVAEATKGKGTDKSLLVDAVMTRFGVPSYEAWAMTIPDLIEKLENDGA
jgi:hypothetical protein